MAVVVVFFKTEKLLASLAYIISNFPSASISVIATVSGNDTELLLTAVANVTVPETLVFLNVLILVAL